MDKLSANHGIVLYFFIVTPIHVKDAQNIINSGGEWKIYVTIKMMCQTLLLFFVPPVQ